MTDIQQSAKIRKAIKQANDRAEKFYKSTTTQYLSLEVSYSKGLVNGEYLIKMNAHYLKAYEVTDEELVRLSTKDYTYDDFVVILKALFDKWRFPIFVTYMEDTRVSERLLRRLKETFHNAVKSGEVYDL